jgi:hypothetical protein
MMTQNFHLAISKETIPSKTSNHNISPAHNTVSLPNSTSSGGAKVISWIYKLNLKFTKKESNKFTKIKLYYLL